MKTSALVAALLLLLFGVTASAQGVFLYQNSFARTRLGSADGPLAGPETLGVMIVGTNVNSLAPIIAPLPHQQGGIAGGVVAVPGVPPNTLVYIQLVAWLAVWGSDLSAVPPEQLGKTDIDTRILNYPFDPTGPPLFQQPAVVPIPEPLLRCFAALGLASWLTARAVRFRR